MFPLRALKPRKNNRANGTVIVDIGLVKTTHREGTGHATDVFPDIGVCLRFGLSPDGDSRRCVIANGQKNHPKKKALNKLLQRSKLLTSALRTAFFWLFC